MDTKTNRKPTKNYRTNRKSTQKTTLCWASSVTMISDLRRRLFFSASMSTHHGKNVTATHHRRAARVVISKRRARASSESGAPIQKPSHFRVGRAGTILYYGLFRFSKPAQPSISGGSRAQPRRLCARTNGARWRIGKYCIAGQNRHPLTQSFSATIFEGGHQHSGAPSPTSKTSTINSPAPATTAKTNLNHGHQHNNP